MKVGVCVAIWVITSNIMRLRVCIIVVRLLKESGDSFFYPQVLLCGEVKGKLKALYDRVETVRELKMQCLEPSRQQLRKITLSRRRPSCCVYSLRCVPSIHHWTGE